MSLDNVKDKIKQKMQFAPPINATVLMDFGDDGKLFINGNENPPEISEDKPDNDADVTLTTSLDTFTAILNGTQDPNIAFMMGKLKVKGSMGLAMKLNGILED